MGTKLISFLLFFILGGESWGGVPTIEGLLQNGKNKEVEGNMIALTFKLKRIPQKLEVEESEEKIVETKEKESFYKMIFFFPKKRKSIELLQVEYGSIQFSKSDILSVKYFPHLDKKILMEENNSRLMTYGLLMMFSLNQPMGIIKLLEKTSGEFKRKKTLMSEKKIRLYTEYKKYLLAIKRDPTLKEKLESPLRPEDEEKMEHVKKILSMPMYENLHKVKLVKMEERFFWQFKLGETEGLFYNDTNLMKSLTISNPEGVFSALTGNYISFDGIHTMPKVIYFDRNTIDRNIFYPQTYQVYNIKNDSLKKRYKNYIKTFKTIRRTEGTLIADQDLDILF